MYVALGYFMRTRNADPSQAAKPIQKIFEKQY